MLSYVDAEPGRYFSADLNLRDPWMFQQSLACEGKINRQYIYPCMNLGVSNDLFFCQAMQAFYGQFLSLEVITMGENVMD